MNSIHDVPNESGTYVLCLYIAEAQSVAVGRLGISLFPAGIYVYVGSAFGPGGLRARLRRHVRGSDTLHWHVDYIRAIAEVHAVWYCATRERLECRWSQTLATFVGADVPMTGFGASDCDSGCEAHLVKLPADVALDTVRDALATTEDDQIGQIDFGKPPNMSTIQGRLRN